MPSYGFSLMCELYDPNELLAQAARAEAAGFDFLTISDHFHPWLFSHHHSPYAWSVLGALAAQTESVELVSLVTCPTIRYHPAIVAQKAATVAVMSGGRFRLGVGAGENLNEHVVGRGWPPVHIRHEMLEEAIEIIRVLWGGGYHAHQGKHYRVDDARIFTLPEEPPPVYVAVSGPQSVALAERAGDGMVAIHPRAELTQPFADAGKPRYGQLALSVDDDESRARRLARELFRFSTGGWKVQSELPNPVNFEAATASVREEDVAAEISCGADPDRHLAAVQQWLAAGFDRIAVVALGDLDRFFELWQQELRPRIESLPEPARGGSS
jgi:G6PDH family F420-dependent oxidoreductase